MSEEARKILARNIEYHMNRLGLDRYQLCEALGLKYTTLATWLQGRKYPRIDKIDAMAKFFGISRGDLINDCTLEQSDIYFYHHSAEALAKEISIEEQLQCVLNRDDEIGDYKYTDDQLFQILEYARFIKGR